MDCQQRAVELLIGSTIKVLCSQVEKVLILILILALKEQLSKRLCKALLTGGVHHREHGSSINITNPREHFCRRGDELGHESVIKENFGGEQNISEELHPGCRVSRFCT